MPETSHLITPKPPVRAFFLAAVASLIGCVVLVLAVALKWGTLVWALGVLVLVAGEALLLVALFSTRARAARLFLDDEGYRLVSRSGQQEGSWDDVTRVTQSADGAVVTIHEGADVRRVLVFSKPDDPALDKVLADISRRLDTAKGYETF